MNQNGLSPDPGSKQARRRRFQLRVQLTSAALILTGGTLAYLELSVVLAGGLMLAGLAALLLTPRA